MFFQIAGVEKKYHPQSFWSFYKHSKGLPVLMGVDLTLNKGDLVGIYGRNGAGKSTLVKIIMKLVAYDRGKINFCGNEVSSDLARDKFKAVFANDNSFFEKLTGKQNLELFLTLNNVKDIDSMISSYSKQLSFTSKLEQPVMHYSTGEKQKLSLIRALASEPELLVLDEAVRSLDKESKKAVERLIVKQGTTTLMFSADKNDLCFCRRVYVLSCGRIAHA